MHVIITMYIEWYVRVAFSHIKGQCMLMRFIVRVSQLRRAGCGLSWENPPQTYEIIWVFVAQHCGGFTSDLLDRGSHDCSTIVRGIQYVSVWKSWIYAVGFTYDLLRSGLFRNHLQSIG